MGRKCCHPECYVTCLQTHKAMVLQLEYMKQQADETKQEFSLICWAWPSARRVQ